METDNTTKMEINNKKLEIVFQRQNIQKTCQKTKNKNLKTFDLLQLNLKRKRRVNFYMMNSLKLSSMKRIVPISLHFEIRERIRMRTLWRQGKNTINT